MILMLRNMGLSVPVKFIAPHAGDTAWVYVRFITGKECLVFAENLSRPAKKAGLWAHRPNEPKHEADAYFVRLKAPKSGVAGSVDMAKPGGAL